MKATSSKRTAWTVALVAALALAGCQDSSDDRGQPGTIDTHGGSAHGTTGVGGHGGSVSFSAGDNVYLRAGDVPDPEFSSNSFELTGLVEASAVAGTGVTNVSANGIRTITSVSNFVLASDATLLNSISTETLLVIIAPTIHIHGTIDLSGDDSTGVATDGDHLSLVANENGGEVYVTGTIDTHGGNGTTGGRGGNVSISAENCGTSLSSPGLTATADIIVRGDIKTFGGNSTDDEAGNGGSVSMTACNDIFVELTLDLGITTVGGSGTLDGGHGGNVYATASEVDTNGGIYAGETGIDASGGNGQEAGNGGSVSFTVVSKTGNTGTGDIYSLMIVTVSGGTGVPVSGEDDSEGGHAGSVSFTTYDSGQDITNHGSIVAVGGSASSSEDGTGGDGGEVSLMTDANDDDLGGHIRNEGGISVNGGTGVLFGGDGGTISLVTDLDDGEDASNGEGENLGDLSARGGDAAVAVSSGGLGGDGGTITLRARGAFQTNAVLDVIAGAAETNGTDGTQTVD